jgi:hypothetical protein
MKKVPVLLFTWTMIAAACQKSHAPIPSDDQGCIEQLIVDRNSPGLSSTDTKTVDSLMDVNHIDHSRVRYYDYRTDTFRAQPSSPGVFEQIVDVNQYVNGRRIFNSNIHYLFYDGMLHFLDSTRITGRSLIGGFPDAKPTLTLPQLRSLFTGDLLKADRPTLHHFTDSCYTAEFGYYDVAPDNAKDLQLVKAWVVSVRSFNYHSMPLAACYRDSDGKLLGFQGAPIN